MNKEELENEFPELYEGTFECEICGNRLDNDCQASPGICTHCE